MSTPPPFDLPQAEPPTAQPPGPGTAPPGQPFTTGGPHLSPAVAGAIGVAVGAGLALAIALPLTLSDTRAAAQADGSPQATVLLDAANACGSPDGVAIEDDGPE